MLEEQNNDALSPAIRRRTTNTIWKPAPLKGTGVGERHDP